MFRFTLIHEVLGSLEISEPDGWKTATFNLKRNTEQGFHSLWETFEGDFTFYGDNGFVNGGIDRINEVIDTYGPDAVLEILIEETVDSYSYFMVFSGVLALDMIQKTPDNTAKVPIIPNDFRTKFKNRYDTPVDIQSAQDLYGNPANVFEASNLELVSQIIQKSNTYDGEVNTTDDVWRQIKNSGDYIDAEGAFDGYHESFTQAQVDLNQEEINESFYSLFDFANSFVDLANAITFADESGEVTISIDEDFSAFVTYSYRLGFDGGDAGSDPSIVDSIVMDAYILIIVNDVTVAVLDFDNDSYNTPLPTPVISPTAGFVNFQFDFQQTSQTVSVNKGDSLRLAMRWRIGFNIDEGTDSDVWWGSGLDGSSDGPSIIIDDYEPKLSVRFKSLYRNTQSESFLVHDAAGMIADRITGVSDSFYSELLGGATQTVYRQYDATGCHWNKILVKGLQLRRYLLAEKPFFLSFKDWWEGINPILNLGLGYDTIDGEEVIRVEDKGFFYNPSMSVLISNVRDISQAFDREEMVKTFRNGYKQWQSENFSGIDDTQTSHVRASRFEKVGTDVTIESSFIAASLAIETTRRTAREKSADYKYDDNTFIIVISDNEGSPDGTFLPEFDEKYEYVNNLNDPETRYNIDLTPARNFLRWAPWLFGGLQHYVGSFFKFVSGEGNYDMESERSVSDGCDEYDGPLAEDQDIEVTDEYYHRPELYTIRINLEVEDYLEIVANRNNAIGISQTTENHKPFFIKELTFEPVGQVVTILAWPVEYFEIQIIDRDPVNQICESDAEDCDDAFLTEDGDTFVTEDGICLILD